MKQFYSPFKLAFIYSIASILSGPLIYAFGYIFTKGRGDYCDAAYMLPNGSFNDSRVIEFRHAQIFQVNGASLMIILGLLLITYLIVDSKMNHTKLRITAILSIVVMVFGYALVILMSGRGMQTC